MGNSFEQSGLFLIQVIFGLLVFALVIRFIMRATQVDLHHPIVHFIAKVTNPLCKPLNYIFSIKGRWDVSAILTAIIIQAVGLKLKSLLVAKAVGLSFLFFASLNEVLTQLLNTIFWLIIIHVILSWLGTYNQNTAIFDQMTRPILRPFQKIFPLMGGFDLSPIIAIITIKLAQILLTDTVMLFHKQLLSFI